MATRNYLFICSVFIVLCWARAVPTKVNDEEPENSPSGCYDDPARVICGVSAGKNCFEDSCYDFPHIRLSLEKSKKYCADWGGDLVSIETKEELEFIQKRASNVTREKQEDEFYIGLTLNESMWEWINGKPLTINHWRSGFPDDRGSVVEMLKLKHQWTLMNPGDHFKFRYICEMPRDKDPRRIVPDCYESSCYKVFDNTLKNWTDAVKACENLSNGYLVTIETECEWYYIKKLVNRYEHRHWWIGLRNKTNLDLTSWKWNSNASYSLSQNLWKPSRPGGTLSQHAMMINPNPDSKNPKYLFTEVRDPCEERGFICEKKLVYKPPQ